MKSIIVSIYDTRNQIWAGFLVTFAFAAFAQLIFNLSESAPDGSASSQIAPSATVTKTDLQRKLSNTHASTTSISGLQDFSRQQRGRRPTSDRDSYPTWEIENQFKEDVFTFVRNSI